MQIFWEFLQLDNS